MYYIGPTDHGIQHGQQLSGKLLTPPLPAVINVITFGPVHRQTQDFQTVLPPGTIAVRRQNAKLHTSRARQDIAKFEQHKNGSAKVSSRIKSGHNVKNFNLVIHGLRPSCYTVLIGHLIS